MKSAKNNKKKKKIQVQIIKKTSPKKKSKKVKPKIREKRLKKVLNSQEKTLHKTFYEQEEIFKRKIMYSGVSFFMILFFIVWFYNFKRDIKIISGQNDNKNIADIKNLQNSFDNLKKELKSLRTEKAKNATSSLVNFEKSDTLDNMSTNTPKFK